MKIKTFTAIAFIMPTLLFNLTAKAADCPGVENAHYKNCGRASLSSNGHTYYQACELVVRTPNGEWRSRQMGVPPSDNSNNEGRSPAKVVKQYNHCVYDYRFSFKLNTDEDEDADE